MVDSHCHLQDAAFDRDRAEVLNRARAAGVVRILVPGWDLASSRRAVALAAERADLIHAAVGIHPHDAAAATDADWTALEALAADPAVVAIGEIGLDFFRNISSPDVQREAFARQLQLATRVGKPVLVHDRDAHEEVSDALVGWAGCGRQPGGVLHAFSGDQTMATRLGRSGFLISFALPVSFSSARGARAAAASLPTESLLLETDSPWLAPGGAGSRNEPATVLRVAAEVARLRGDSPQGVADAARSAYARLVGGQVA